jgi:hypothetical protein
MDESKLKQIAKEYGYDLSPAEPKELPKPTLWPITLAFGLIMFFWGFLTSFIFSGVAFFIIVLGLTGWIQEYKHE